MKTADNGKKSMVGRVAGIFAAVVLVVVFISPPFSYTLHR